MLYVILTKRRIFKHHPYNFFFCRRMWRISKIKYNTNRIYYLDENGKQFIVPFSRTGFKWEHASNEYYPFNYPIPLF